MTDGQSDSPVREVRDASDRTWHVYVVLERRKLDPDVKTRRRNWLCLETADQRRFISPVPEGWEHWSDEQLRAAILAAKPDIRGP
jgi:hypothetical protein